MEAPKYFQKQFAEGGRHLEDLEREMSMPRPPKIQAHLRDEKEYFARRQSQTLVASQTVERAQAAAAEQYEKQLSDIRNLESLPVIQDEVIMVKRRREFPDVPEDIMKRFGNESSAYLNAEDLRIIGEEPKGRLRKFLDWFRRR